MPASGPVYQPTTVTYEQQPDWTPASYLSQTVSHGLDRSRCVQWLLLIVGLFVVAAGLIMLVEGVVDFANTHQETDVDDTPTSGDVVIACVGGALVILGLLMLTLYLKFAARRRNKAVCPVFAGMCCPCFPNNKRPPLDAANGQMLTVNPSTDLLVSAQYAPVNEIAYQAPTLAEEEETRTLMAADHKDKKRNENNILEENVDEDVDAELESLMPDVDELSSCSGVISAMGHDEFEDITLEHFLEKEANVNKRPAEVRQPATRHPPKGGPRRLKKSASRRRMKAASSTPNTLSPADAPLAKAEELTPSLRSSYASIYQYQDYEDDSDEDGSDDVKSRLSLPAAWN